MTTTGSRDLFCGPVCLCEDVICTENQRSLEIRWGVSGCVLAAANGLSQQLCAALCCVTRKNHLELFLSAVEFSLIATSLALQTALVLQQALVIQALWHCSDATLRLCDTNNRTDIDK